MAMILKCKCINTRFKWFAKSVTSTKMVFVFLLHYIWGIYIIHCNG